MTEDSIRAISIAAGLFIIILTISAIFIYVDTAKQFANATSNNISKWKYIDYTNIMEYEEDVTIDAKGIDVINFIRKYAMRDDIRIKMGDRENFEYISAWKNDIGNASEEKLQKIASVADVKISKKKFGEIYNIEVRGNVFRELQKIQGLLYGDINRDGKIGKIDLDLLKNYLNILSQIKDISQTDVNGDGIVNNLDSTLLSKHLANWNVEIRGGDLDNNGKVDSADVELLAQYIQNDLKGLSREAADVFFDGVIDEQDLEKLASMVVRYTVSYSLEDLDYSNKEVDVYTGESYSTTIHVADESKFVLPYSIIVTMSGKELAVDVDYTYNSANGEITINEITGNIVIIAKGMQNTTFTYAKVITEEQGRNGFTAEIEEPKQLRIFKFVPNVTANYTFYSNDPQAAMHVTDPVGYIFASTNISLEDLEAKVASYSQTGNATSLYGYIISNDDGGGLGLNFSITRHLEQGNTYYLVVRTFSKTAVQTFDNIYIVKN